MDSQASREFLLGEQSASAKPIETQAEAIGVHDVRMVRQSDGSFAIYFADAAIPSFAASGLPSAVLALAAEHVRNHMP